MRAIKDQAELIGPAHQGFTQRAEATIGRAHIRGAVSKLAVAEVHRRDHAQAANVEGIEHRNVRTQRIGVFHALENNLLTGGCNPFRIGGGEGEFHIVVILRGQFADRHLTQHGHVARRQIGGFVQRALRREDHPESAIQPAFIHARQVDMRAIHIEIASFGEVVFGVMDISRGIKVGIKHQREEMDFVTG